MALTSSILLYNQNEWKHKATCVYSMGYTGISRSQGRDETLCDSGYHIEHDFTSNPLFTENRLYRLLLYKLIFNGNIPRHLLTAMPSCHAQKYSVCLIFGIMPHRAKCNLNISAMGVSSKLHLVKSRYVGRNHIIDVLILLVLVQIINICLVFKWLYIYIYIYVCVCVCV